MKPIVNGLEKQYGKQIEFVFINREAPENQTIVKKYGVRSQPIFILLDRQGEIVQRFSGPVSEDVLAEALQSLVE
ncbi:MAG: hypothetical protein DSY55_05925 [Clostridia bacterium]|nr:MAG: hypothetical protein DSY55_05925 [Clostridia bacterium]